MRPTLGIDIAKSTFAVHLLHPDHTLSGSFDNSPKGFEHLQRRLEQISEQPIHVCLEATGRYGHGLACFLHQRGHRVSLVNPARIKAFGETLLQRTKTDATDARLIAHFCQLHRPAAWTPLEPDKHRLQQLTRRRGALLKMRQQERNRLQSGVSDEFVRQSLRDHIAFLTQQIETVETQTQHLIAHNPSLKQADQLLRTIPGIGAKSAPIILAEIPEIGAFDHAGQLVAYAGVNPQQHRSGTSVRKQTRISKRGNTRLRAALYFPAITAKNRYETFQAFTQRLEAKGHCKMSIVCAIMRKLLHLVFGILKSGQPFDPHYRDKLPVAA